MELNFIFNTDFFTDRKNKTAFKKSVTKIVKGIFSLEKRSFDNLNILFTDDEEIRELNNKYLAHNYSTDILTFGYDEDESDIIISVETVKSNSKTFKTTFKNELFRVIIHGLLHLCGYDDVTKDEKDAIRKLEDSYLKIFKQECSIKF